MNDSVSLSPDIVSGWEERKVMGAFILVVFTAYRNFRGTGKTYFLPYGEACESTVKMKPKIYSFVIEYL